VAALAREARRDRIIRLKSVGPTVDVWTRAYETTGQVQEYAFSYVVQRGVIVTAQATLLTTSS
jgi:hypothetical protein